MKGKSAFITETDESSGNEHDKSKKKSKPLAA